MKRAAAAATVALLATAGAGSAGAATGGPQKRSIKAVLVITPPVHLFGDRIAARATVTASEGIDPARIHVRADFTPYEPIGPPTVERSRTPRYEQVVWTWTLQCHTSPCVPRAPPTDKFTRFQFRPLFVDYAPAGRGRGYDFAVSWPPVEVRSAVSPAVVDYLDRHQKILWGSDVKLARPSYTASPALVFDLSLGAGIAALLAAGVLASWWLFRIWPRRRAAAARLEVAAALERALALFVSALERGDETTQRKALERIAAELSPRGNGLVTRIRELAWSRPRPDTVSTGWVVEQVPTVAEDPSTEVEQP